MLKDIIYIQAAEAESAPKKRPHAAVSDGANAHEDSDLELDFDEKKQVLPSFSNEASRNQYLVRTGMKGKRQSRALVYQGEAERLSQLSMAKRLCRKMCQMRGLEIPKRFMDD